MAATFYPNPSKDALNKTYLGKSLHDVPLPSAILDVAKIKENCRLMLEAAKELNVDFRAHIKTHKTTELTKFQVGENSKDVRVIVSTIAEAEFIVPLLKAYQAQGASTNMLYALPVGLSHIDSLTKIALELGPGSLTLMIDNPCQLKAVESIYAKTKFAIHIFLKTDCGYHRAGVLPQSATMATLVDQTLKAESAGQLEIIGFYTHNSLSYGGNSPADAMDHMRVEIETCMEAVSANIPSEYLKARSTPFVVSCGASPTALSIQNIQGSNKSASSTTASATALKEAIARAKSANVHFEVHAGVYPVFDMQQVAASSRDTFTADPHNSIAFTVLTEVCSTYPDRTEFPEALTNAGGLALAREPCKDYRGQGVVSPWNMGHGYDAYSKAGRIITDRISQEHGILQWEDKTKKEPLPVEYGQRLKMWPNHACITGAQYQYYLVTDSSDESQGEKIIDVWIRCRGW